MNQVVEPLIFKVEIPIEEKARVMPAIVDLFKEFVENHDGYDLKYDTYEPYYSGHEWIDRRESTVFYTVARDDAEQISASVYTESRDLPYPTDEHPRGIEDISAKLCIVLRDPTNEGLLKMFELLQNLCRPGGSVSELAYRGKHLHFYVHRTGWEFVRRPTATQGVTVVAATEKRKIVLVAQHRIPVGKTVIELPAGLVGDTGSHEQVKAAAKRELEEETGYTCEDVEIICSGPVLPGVTDEINSLCWAKGLESQIIADDTSDDQVYEHEIEHGIKDEGEEIHVYDVPLRTVEEWLDEQIEDDQAVDLKVYLGVLFLKNVFN